MDKKISHKLIGFFILAIFIVALIVILHFISPQEIVNKIGVRNGYLLVFLISFFGGFSAGGSISFISVLITLAVGGLNPVFLGLISGTSLAIGDVIMFYAGSKGRELIKNKWDQRFEKITEIFKSKKWLYKIIPIIVYLYIGFTPLPNDLMILFLAAIRYPMKKMSVIIILGDLSFALTVAILASKGITYIT
ncbi:MAG: hypothetical protein Q8P20_06155 [bacterium]|nr:hypothetical protein [bacterium]